MTPYDLPFPRMGVPNAPLVIYRMAISPQQVIRSISCLVLWFGFLGRGIEWRYFRFDQTQDGGHDMMLPFAKLLWPLYCVWHWTVRADNDDCYADSFFCWTEFSFPACRVTDDKHIYNIINCQQPGQVFHVHSATVAFSHQYNATDDKPRCTRNLTCSTTTQHSEIMNCNGKPMCSFSQDVFNFTHASRNCSWSKKASRISIAYSCIDGKHDSYMCFSHKVKRLCVFIIFHVLFYFFHFIISI